MKKNFLLGLILILISTGFSLGQRSSYSLSAEPGILLYNGQYVDYNRKLQIKDSKMMSYSFYYSKNWKIVKELEYRLKPGISLAASPNFTSLQISNCLRKWLNEDCFLNADFNIGLYMQGQRLISSTYGLGFGIKLMNSFYIVPAIHKPFIRAYGHAEDSGRDYFLDWHLKLGLEWNLQYRKSN